MANTNNILIGSPGIAGGQSSTIMIGNTAIASSGTVQTACYLTGVYGTTVTSGQTVVVDSNGKLGTVGGASVALTKFLYAQETNAPNVTGDGTVYTVGSSIALTKIFDANNDMTTAGVFTAPTTGYYTLIYGTCVNNLLAATLAGPIYRNGQNGGMTIAITGTDAATYSFATPWSMAGCGEAAGRPVIGYITNCDQQSAIVTVSVHMTAGDTARFKAGLIGSAGAVGGAKITGIGPIGTNAYTATSTFISGYKEF